MSDHNLHLMTFDSVKSLTSVDWPEHSWSEPSPVFHTIQAGIVSIDTRDVSFIKKDTQKQAESKICSIGFRCLEGFKRVKFVIWNQPIQQAIMSVADNGHILLLQKVKANTSSFSIIYSEPRRFRTNLNCHLQMGVNSWQTSIWIPVHIKNFSSATPSPLPEPFESDRTFKLNSQSFIQNALWIQNGPNLILISPDDKESFVSSLTNEHPKEQDVKTEETEELDETDENSQSLTKYLKKESNTEIVDITESQEPIDLPVKRPATRSKTPKSKKPKT
ncbi:hypothetical protein GEMRC1_002237 [Eukaryota sp. GEM-RC1]